MSICSDYLALIDVNYFMIYSKTIEDINERYSDGKTLLMKAVIKDNREIIEYILRKYNNVDIFSPDRFWFNAIHYAAYNKETLICLINNFIDSRSFYHNMPYYFMMNYTLKQKIDCFIKSVIDFHLINFPLEYRNELRDYFVERYELY